MTCKTVEDQMPPRGGFFRVWRLDRWFDATVCYGMHEPWWVPRNGFTKVESPPITMQKDDLWQGIELPP